MDELAKRRDRYLFRFPRLVQHGSPTLDFDRGWDGLVMELMDGIDRALTDEEAAGFDIVQIKEKWGTLRFYWSNVGPSEREGLSDHVDSLVQQAHEKSKVTCMFCGGAGIMHTKGWVHVSCDRCRIERLAKFGGAR